MKFSIVKMQYVFMLASQWYKQIARTSDKDSDRLNSDNNSNFHAYWKFQNFIFGGTTNKNWKALTLFSRKVIGAGIDITQSS